MTFRVGQRVVCVDAEAHGLYTPWPGLSGLDGLAQNRIYAIRHIGDYRGQSCLWVEEIKRPISIRGYGEPGFSILRFRPLVEKKTDISIFTAMLNPSRQKERIG